MDLENMYTMFEIDVVCLDTQIDMIMFVVYDCNVNMPIRMGSLTLNFMRPIDTW